MWKISKRLYKLFKYDYFFFLKGSMRNLPSSSPYYFYLSTRDTYTLRNKPSAANDYTSGKYDIPFASTINTLSLNNSTIQSIRNEDSARRLKTGTGSESTAYYSQSWKPANYFVSARCGTSHLRSSPRVGADLGFSGCGTGAGCWNSHPSSSPRVGADLGLSGAGFSSARARALKPANELGSYKNWQLGGSPHSRAEAGRDSPSSRGAGKDPDFSSSRRRRARADAAEHKATTNCRSDARRSSVRPSRAGPLGSSGRQQGGACRSYRRPLSAEDLARQKIAEENKAIVKSGRFPLDLRNVETVTDTDHALIKAQLRKASFSAARGGGRVTVTRETSIGAAISYHMSNPHSPICVLSFADAHQAGGGYLRGRGAQEETLCRQTLLYPTIRGNLMYAMNEGCRNGCASDVMIYSPNVYVIRDDSYDEIDHPFMVNIISAAAVDNRSGDVTISPRLMEERIRKIVRLAAARKNDVLILGAFGCGVFKNDPKKISAIFKKVLKDEGMKNYFTDVIFPIKDSKMSMIFQSALY